MKTLNDYINEASKPKFDTSWFQSNECAETFDKLKEEATDKERELFDIIGSTGEIWKKFEALMKSAVKHEDFSPEVCATSASMDKIIREGVKKFNTISDSKIGNLSAESKKRIGLMLVHYWEE